MVTKDGEGDKLGDWNCHIHTTIYKIEANKNLVIQHKELSAQYSVMTYMGK